MARIIFSWLFIILVYFFFNNGLLTQLQQPVLTSPAADGISRFSAMLSIPQFFLQHSWAALLFDILLTCSCIVCVIVPQQRIFTWIVIMGVWILYLVFCTVAGKYNTQIGYLLAPIPFIALSEKRFDLLWKLFRYWVCFLFVTAGIYATWNGIFGEGTIQWFYRLSCLFNLVLLAGFFTLRYDRWILAGLLFFHFGNYLLLHTSFVEQSLIFAPFLPWHKWANHFK